ncbi:MAG: hypothetical protein ABR559_00380, partial [Gemmatimonadota bacterium]
MTTHRFLRLSLHPLVLSAVSLLVAVALVRPAPAAAQKPSAATATRASTISATAPVLARVEPLAGGYALIGSGFGAKSDQVQVFEGPRPLPATSVVSVVDDRIEVRSKASGPVGHKVVVAGVASGILAYNHGGANPTQSLPTALSTSTPPVAAAPLAATGPTAAVSATRPFGASGSTSAASPAAAVLSTVALSPASVTGGATVDGTVTLSAPAPAAGATITLGHGGGTGPGTVTVAAGQRTATFQTATPTVAAPATVTVQASYSGQTRSAQVQVTPAPSAAALAVAEIWNSCNCPRTGSSGGRIMTLVNLTALAPPGGVVVEL